MRHFKVGDRVRIRQWDDMEKEFSLDKDGDINLSVYCFSKYMKHLCGRTATIKSISGRKVELKEWSIGSDTRWNYSTDMIEHVGPKDLLKHGDILEANDGDYYIYLSREDRIGKDLVLLSGTGFMRLSHYDEELICDSPENRFTIKKIYRISDNVKLIQFIKGRGNISCAEKIWERESVKEMTIAEISKELGYEVKVVKE